MRHFPLPAGILVISAIAVIQLTLPPGVARASIADTEGGKAGLQERDKPASFSMSQADRLDLMNPLPRIRKNKPSGPRMRLSDNQDDQDDDDSVEITPVETEPDTEQSPSPQGSPKPVETEPSDSGDTGML